MILPEWDTRIYDVVDACSKFCDEADYPLTFSRTNTLFSLYYVFKDPNAAIIVDYTEDVLNGFAILQRTNEAHEEYLGYINKFYVVPSRRHTRAAYRLMDVIVEWFDNKECILSFANSMARIGKDRAFIKLLSRFNYEATDTGTFIRKLNNESTI